MRCGQLPSGRWFWVERAFCDMAWHGPGAAAGMVIWNHGIHSTVAAHTAPVPPVFRLLQARGWDVLKIARNNLGETGVEQSLYRAVQRTLEEVTARRREGYTRVVLAGQSFGGYVTLEAAESSKDVFGVIAMAPGVRTIGGAGRLDSSVTERSLGRLTTDRLVLVFPRGDTLFGNQDRGPGAARALGRRPYLMLDETDDVRDHGGGTTGRFAAMYGVCVAEYLAAPRVEPGRARCEKVNQPAVARELLPNHPAAITFEMPPAGTALIMAQPPARRWYGFLEPSGEIVSFAVVKAGSLGPRALLGSASGWRGGGLYPFSAGADGVTFRVGGRGTVTVKAGVLTWTPTAGGREQTAELFPLGEE
jgi:hypothetical protein